MPVNPYLPRTSSRAVSPWVETLPMGKSIFDYYPIDPLTTISSSTQIPNVLDGPIVVRRYASLTLSNTLTTQYRCRGLCILVDGNLTLNSGGIITMTGKGAKGHSGMRSLDMLIPNSIQLQSNVMTKKAVLDRIYNSGYAMFDQYMWDEWALLDGVKCTAFTGGTTLISNAGCGKASTGTQVGTSYASGIPGVNGSSGGPGSGGGGGVSSTLRHRGGHGNPWGGGSGSGGYMGSPGSGGAASSPMLNPNGDDYGGRGGDGNYGGADPNAAGGGAGNPGGASTNTGTTKDGTGGILIIIVKGIITLNTGSIIQADGIDGASVSSYYFGGGGSGGGHISLIVDTKGGTQNTTFTGDDIPLGETGWNNGTVRVNGGAAGTAPTSGAHGGAGGTGSIRTNTFAEMGW